MQDNKASITTQEDSVHLVLQVDIWDDLGSFRAAPSFSQPSEQVDNKSQTIWRATLDHVRNIKGKLVHLAKILYGCTHDHMPLTAAIRRGK